ncbi:MAG: histidine kinase [Bacteroidetes bacterium]|nr:histidine kinase [Bacteroidota bacterium]
MKNNLSHRIIHRPQKNRRPAGNKTLIPFIFALFFSTISTNLLAQQYSYVNYDVKDGLAGSTVYSMVQDKDGFIWFGTETGLSRFDGTHFKNFTTADGLPDNEIIKLFVDSKNRVWIVSFRNSLCYYLKGKIYNVNNDSLLKKINQVSELMSIVENASGDLLIMESNALHIIDHSGQIHEIKQFAGQNLRTIKAGLNEKKNFRIATTFEYHFNLIIADIKDNNLTAIENIPVSLTKNNRYGCTFFTPLFSVVVKGNALNFTSKRGVEFRIPLSEKFIGASSIDDSTFAFNYIDKTLVFDAVRAKFIDSLSVGSPVNNVMRDSEGSLWFSTLGKGIYRLTSSEFENFSFRTGSGLSSVVAIEKIDSTIYIGGENFYLYALDQNLSIVKSVKIMDSYTRGRIITINKISDKKLLIGSDGGMFICEKWNPKPFFLGVGIKDVFADKDGKIEFSSSRYALRIDPNDPRFLLQRYDVIPWIDTIWSDRATCIYKLKDTNYVGTLNGLVAISDDKGYTFVGEQNELLQKRIAAIRGSNDGTLWVGTSGSGLVAYSRGKVVRNITDKDGLTSNICRNLFIANNDIWVGTDKGLNRVHATDTGYNITTFTTVDGLKSDIINAVYVDGENVLVGTPEGLTRFNVSKKAKTSSCKLYITDITVSGKQMPYAQTDFLLPHKDNNIRIDFVAISFKSAGSILYKYRLAPDTIWRLTNQNSLNYPSLTSGSFVLELAAVNKFGVESDHAFVKFTVEKLLREKIWFQLTLFLSATALVIFFVYLRIQNLKKKEAQKTILAAKLSELEQMALRSQMNPHFIFNSLNSIQQYVIDKDILGANEFITQFSRLIRLTLDYSSKQDISLEQEIVYVSTYLELEKKRFENKFVYEILVDPKINREDYFIPPMILQPYIENSVRHGMRYKKDANGKIKISFHADAKYLVCNIEDNGIGRKQALQFKSIIPVEYQSKGMTLTARRIEVFNTTHEASIKINIEDPEDHNHTPVGTKVTIQFPLQEAYRPNNLS